VSEAFPREQRGKALGLIGASVGLGLTIGPPLGGWILDAAGWRWIFYVNLPVGAVATWLCLRWLPPRTADALAPGAGAPRFDAALFRNRTFVAALVALFLSFVALFAVVFLGPFYLQRIAGLGPSAVGRVLVVIPLLLVVLSPASGALSDRFGPRPLAVAGLAITTFGLALFAWLIGGATEHPLGVPAVLVALVVIGAGQSFFQPPNSSAAVGSVPASRFGVAGGLLATMRNLGMLCGIALAAAIYEGREAVYAAAGRTPVAAAGLAMRDAFAAAAVAAAIALVWTATAGPVVTGGSAGDAPFVDAEPRPAKRTPPIV
jgi:predicted MFS family arabinose efflux permease